MKIKSMFLMMFLILFLSLSVNAQIEYQPFEWADIEFNGEILEKVAMLFPVKLPGIEKTFYMQFDTGYNGTHFYGKIMLKHGIFKSLHEVSQLEFSWIKNSSDSIEYSSSAWVGWDTDDSVIIGSEEPLHNIIGSLGCNMLRDRIMIIDFPKKLFSVLTDSQSTSLNNLTNVNFSPMRNVNDRLFIDVIIDKDTLKDVFYDTGSSTTFLLLPLDDWTLATGKKLDDDGVKKTFTISWGDSLANYIAPLKGDLKISEVKITAPPIEYVDWGYEIEYSLIGNAPFFNSYIVVLDCINNRFGIKKIEE